MVAWGYTGSLSDLRDSMDTNTQHGSDRCLALQEAYSNSNEDSLVYLMQARRAAMQERLLAYKLLVSEQMLAQGLSNVGDSRRMERFFGKLLRGVHGRKRRPSCLISFEEVLHCSLGPPT